MNNCMIIANNLGLPLVCSYEEEEIYEGNIVWTDDQWALQNTRSGHLVRHRRNSFTPILVVGMNVSIFCFEHLGYYLSKGLYLEAEYKQAILRMVIMRILDITPILNTDPLDLFLMPEGEGRIKLSRHVTRENIPCVCVNELQSFSPGKGGGRRMIKAIIDASDEIGVNLVLKVRPFDHEYLNKEQLLFFYEKYGFIKSPYEWYIRKAR